MAYSLGAFQGRRSRHGRGGAEGDLMELNGRASPRMLRRYGTSARRGYGRVMDSTP